MKFKLNTSIAKSDPIDCLIIGIFEQNKLTPAAQEINELSQHYISSLLKENGNLAKIGQTLLLHHVPHTNNSNSNNSHNSHTPKILLVGCGKEGELQTRDYRKIVFNSIKALQPLGIKKALSYLTELPVNSYPLSWRIKHAVEVTAEAMYRFDEFKSKPEPAYTLNEMAFYVPEKSALEAAKKALKQAISITQGIELTKNLANLPSNICTPSYLAAEAKKLAKQYPTLTATVLEESQMKKLGMGALLAVAQGSAQDAKLICLQYKGKGAGKKTAPVALIGKGITFDTGGISLKPADGMIGMKYDMCGAATVLGVLKAAAELELPANLVGIIAATENMPSGTAIKPEDIVTSLSGQTIEIMNTDAEGRLVLCDALTYSERYQPDTVIDIATLTGAVVIALGHHASGLLSNHDPLAEDLLAAGTESHDRAWQLPLWEDYQEQLKSPFADVSNVGGRGAGTITAACFLSRFAKKFHWAHLDVAGTAANKMGGPERAATGRPVPLLMQYLINRFSKK